MMFLPIVIIAVQQITKFQGNTGFKGFLFCEACQKRHQTYQYPALALVANHTTSPF